MKENIRQEKKFPEGMVPLGKSIFSFACHEGCACFTNCCRKLDMFLYPFDIVRLKNSKGMTSEQFLQRYTRLAQGSHPYFPAVMMRMTDEEDQACPFLGESGCSVYKDRPSACRTYPLERAVGRTVEGGRPEEYYFLTKHSYCLGHNEHKKWVVDKWLRDQQVLDYNTANDLWAEVDTIFSQNPWQGEGAAGPKQQLAFMVCYNIDGFRAFAAQSDLLSQFKLDKSRARMIAIDDEALLKFGFDWLKFVLRGSGPLRRR